LSLSRQVLHARNSAREAVGILHIQFKQNSWGFDP
jgi:hypothetical protein